MKLFIWKSVDNATHEYHSGGGLLVVASDLESARSLIRKSIPEGQNYSWSTKPPGGESCSALHKDPDAVFEVEASQESYFVFPNAGCC